MIIIDILKLMEIFVFGTSPFCFNDTRAGMDSTSLTPNTPQSFARLIKNQRRLRSRNCHGPSSTVT